METVQSPNHEGIEQIYIPAEFLWDHLPAYAHKMKIDTPIGGPLGGILNTCISVINYAPDRYLQEELLQPGTEVWVLLFLGPDVYVQKPECPLFAIIPRGHIDEP